MIADGLFSHCKYKLIFDSDKDNILLEELYGYNSQGEQEEWN